jgi:hypothetical protein
MMLTSRDIRLILSLTQRKEVAGFDRYRVTEECSGYHPDPAIAALQAKLSIMLEVASKMEVLEGL